MFVSGKLIQGCSIVEVVVGMLFVPSLWLLLGCVCEFCISLFLDERGIYHHLLQLTKVQVFCVFVLCESLEVHKQLIVFMCMCCCQKV